MSAVSYYTDPLYGAWPIPADVEHIIGSPTFQRLRRVSQSGASKYAHPSKTVTRFEHSVGVYLLLRQLGAERQEQIAGLLHDISHTAFSHVIDIVYYSKEQDLHERLKGHFLTQPDLRKAIEAAGLQVEDFLHDQAYTLLEQPLPTLCADRIDYCLRDALTVGAASEMAVKDILFDLTVRQKRIAMRTAITARKFASLFKRMNDTYWASQMENFLYSTLAQAIEIGLATGALQQNDLLKDDDAVEAKLRAADNPQIDALFDKLVEPPAAEVAAFTPTRPIKQRSIDPPVLWNGGIVPLSKVLGHRSPSRPTPSSLELSL